MNERCRGILEIRCTYDTTHDGYHSYLGISQENFRTLQARLSRYETAMREALRILGPAWRYKDAAAILCAALSDQPAAEPAESKLKAVFQKHIRQCQSMVETFDRVGPEHMKTFHQGMVAGLERAIEIINYRDAQPSTPEEGAKEPR